MVCWTRTSEGQPSAASFWGSFLLRFLSSLIALPVLLLLLCSGRVSECTDDCPLVNNGRLAECTRPLNFTSQSNQKVLEKCRKRRLQEVPKCLAKIVEECNQIMKPDQEQADHLEQTVQYWLNRAKKFDKMCAEFVELHHSASSVSGDRNFSQRPFCSVAMVTGLLVVCFVAFPGFVVRFS